MWRDAGSLVDMLKAARKVGEYATGLDESSFLANSRDQDAILRQLTIVGEAAKRVSNEFRTSHPEVPWRRVAGFRDVVVHDYFNEILPPPSEELVQSVRRTSEQFKDAFDEMKRLGD